MAGFRQKSWLELFVWQKCCSSTNKRCWSRNRSQSPTVDKQNFSWLGTADWLQFSQCRMVWCSVCKLLVFISSQDTLIAVSHRLNHFPSELKSHVMSLCHIGQRLNWLPTRFNPVIWQAIIDLFFWCVHSELRYRYWFHLIGPWAGRKGSEYEVVNPRLIHSLLKGEIHSSLMTELWGLINLSF